MRKFGLIGYPLSHSFSPSYFAEKFKKLNIDNCRYDAYPIDAIEKVLDLIEDPALEGFNITIPYKEQIIPFLDEMSVGAQTIGAVNCVKIERSDKGVRLVGHNTDEYGFRTPLERVIQESHKTALILGTGGAAKAVLFALVQLGLDVKFASRNPRGETVIGYDSLTAANIGEFDVIVNCSPIGMYPNVDASPAIPYEGLKAGQILYDLVYNPLETEFLKKGKAKGATVVQGLEMLHLQADRSWEIWNV